jgi:hypothetical protein
MPGKACVRGGTVVFLLTMKAKLLAVFCYQGDALNLPVADSEVSAAFYASTMGFAEAERANGPVKRVVI